jgi:Ni/Fe-hydrogenase 1 B-type cytochrome subunit
MAEQIRRVLVWSGRLRLTHWLLAVTSITLISTGWLIDAAPSLAEAASDYHLLAASVMTLALAVRIWLGFFGTAAERFEHLLLSNSELRALSESLVFYLSFGKAPLPNWYAHNPLWKSFYLIMFLLLAGLAMTGWLMPDMPLIGSVYLPTLHAGLANFISVLLGLHLFSVVLQDYRGRSADISAMINGHRYFGIDRDGLVKPKVQEVSIRLDDIDQR